VSIWNWIEGLVESGDQSFRISAVGVWVHKKKSTNSGNNQKTSEGLNRALEDVELMFF
jgi:hypothetical protein